MHGCRQHRRSYDWEVFVAIGAAFGAGDAMELTGLAQGIADIFINASECAEHIVCFCSCVFAFRYALMPRLLMVVLWRKPQKLSASTDHSPPRSQLTCTPMQILLGIRCTR